MSRATTPLHPSPVIENGFRILDAGAFEEHHQVVIAVGSAEDFVAAVPVHADPATP